MPCIMAEQMTDITHVYTNIKPHKLYISRIIYTQERHSPEHAGCILY